MQIEHWPLIKEKLQALEQLVLEQLTAHHESTSPWNSHVFVRKKEIGGSGQF